MKPLKLTVEGIGCFADRHEWDFSAFRGLFGIFGPTGSGKSTLTDAITLALYGAVPRYGKNTEGQFISLTKDSAFVAFTFELNYDGELRTYRIEREFKMDRRKTPPAFRQSAVRFGVYKDGKIEISSDSKKTETNKAIEAHIGLTYEDFTRTVMLPQGRFAEFLTLKGADRNQILQRIFHLTEYGDKLRKRISEAKSKAESKTALLSQRLEQYAFATPENIKATQERIEALSIEQQQALANRNRLEEVRRVLYVALDTLTRLGVAKKRLNALLQDRDRIEALRAEHANAESAAGILSEITEQNNALEKSRDEYRRKKAQQESQKQAVAAAEQQLAILQDEQKSLREQQAALGVDSSFREKLTRALVLETQLLDAQKGLVDAQAKEKAASAEGARLVKEYNIIEETREKYVEMTKAIDERARLLAALRLEIEALEHHVNELTAQNQAAAIAIGLKDGAACPVCGSTHHPKPAESADTALADKKKRLEARKLQEKRESKTLEAETRNQNENAQKLSAFEAAYNERAKQLEAQKSETAKLIHDLTEHYELLYAEYTELAGELGVPENQPPQSKPIKALSAARAKKDQQLAKLIDEDNKLTHQINVAEMTRREHEKNYNQTTTEISVMEALGQSQRDAVERLKANLYAISADFVGVSLKDLIGRYAPEKRKAMSDEVARYDSELSEVKGIITELEQKQTERDEQDVRARYNETTTALEKLDANLTAIIGETAQLKDRLEQYENMLEQVNVWKNEKKSLDKRLGLLADLDGVFKGNAFIEYLSRRNLEYIAQDASKRLSAMTNGRYGLELSDLDFVIRDRFSQSVRNPASLSGGETFMVSLCLALSLSAKIQIGSGTRLDFFFLDEGFGSLDSNTLVQVMEILFSLPDERLLVGVITHVERMKEEIEQRIIL